MDRLTGLPTHRDLAGVLAELQTRYPSTAGWSAVFFDIDGLVWVNDRQGFEAGDALLARIAQWLRSRLAMQSGTWLRVSGDGFLVLLPETSLADAARLAREALDACERLRIPYRREDDPRDFVALNAVVSAVEAEIDIERVREDWAVAIYHAKCSQKRKYSVIAVLS